MKIKRFALGALWTNCYVISDAASEGIVIDPGGPAAEVEEYIRDNDIRLHWIILTHGHGDHIGGVSELRNLSENGIAVHTEDADCLVDANRNLSAFMGTSVELPSADKKLNEGDTLKVGSMNIRVIHTPGHTVGGICLHIKDEDEEVLISGDTLFARSIGRSDLPGGDEDVLVRSLKKLTDFPDKLRVLPGHGPETTIGAEKIYNPYWPR
ncbi:MAG: MBL fold metallo-hydrolase [Synergistaceae bacterium]|jgi:glyoxylase-like metal-dependent hydrolase (beta-lactamase superfamily II)|nr:MBL fold metallo-hydrolase [Synergistaceae bacterium]MCK9436386.1 MBL fold metallo-hydrolase [Synergistaceae bacterium]MDD2350569.1 MBL fold metallo-hydrolase [Synergistaceae bacterium]MDD3319116.1 MBL fold metallo-hydrolase [Synergistaceae bacterium]MDD3672508.1 MBL fold metallo-hydrolase [Synergistaceae bacterium]